MLTDAIEPSILSGLISVHFNKKLASYKYTSASDSGNGSYSGISLQFSDNTEAYVDLLVGADGVRSATRASMYKFLASHYSPDSVDCKKLLKHVEPSWTGTFAYRALADTAKLRDVKKKDGDIGAVHRSAIKGVVVCSTQFLTGI